MDPASNAEDDEAARDDTIIDWNEPDDGQHGWYIVTPATPTAIRSSGPDPTRTTRSSSNEHSNKRFHRPTEPSPRCSSRTPKRSQRCSTTHSSSESTRRPHVFSQEYDVDDDGNSKNLERLQRACDVRRIWMDR